MRQGACVYAASSMQGLLAEITNECGRMGRAIAKPIMRHFF